MPGVKATMDEWKAGTLHSGSKTGPVVESRKQAIAIALDEERKAGAPATRAKNRASTRSWNKHT